MPFFDWTSWLRSLYRPNTKTFRQRRSGRIRPSLEALEDRTLLSVLPVALPGNQQQLPTGFPDPQGNHPLTGAQVAIDPTNPNDMVAVASYNPADLTKFVPGLDIWYSTNGGTTWSIPLTTFNLFDPNLFTNNPPFTYTENTNASLSFDRLHNFYIVASQHDAAYNSGAITLNKFNFSGAAPAPVIFDPVLGDTKVLYSWLGQDPAYNPVIGIDTNVPTFTDPKTGAVQIDSLGTNVRDQFGKEQAKAIYVAWNTVFTQPVLSLLPNISQISVAASDDGAFNFTTNEYASNAALPSAAPSIAFTSATPDGTVPGGKLLLVWSGANSLKNPLMNQIVLDSSAPDGGVATAPAAAGFMVTSPPPAFPQAAPTPIIDATVPAATPPNNVPGLTDSFLTVNVADPNFIAVNDLNVTLNLVHPHLNQLTITLTYVPTNTTVTLVQSAVNPVDGSTIPNTGLPDAANLGELVSAGPNFVFHPIGTVFDSRAPRSIRDGSAAAPYIGHYRPELGNLAVFNGLTAAQVKKPNAWRLRIADNSNDGGNIAAPGQFLQNWSLTFSSGISTTRFGLDSNLPTQYTDVDPNKSRGVTINGGNGLTTGVNNQYQLVNATSGPSGIAPSISVAVDHTLGSFSPHQGTIYVAYTGYSPAVIGAMPPNLNNTDVFVMSSTNGGATWSSQVKVNDDAPLDGFSEGSRPQFMPTVAVDPTTGTVGVVYYDGRWDPTGKLAANSFSASIDGGQTFSPSAFLNNANKAIDAVTGKTIIIDPILGNQSVTNTPWGYGDRQGLVMYGGKVIPVYSSNDNAAGAVIKTATATIAAGPRIISASMGPITTGSFAADGTAQFTGFTVQFDRPVDVSTFTAAQVQIVYRDTVTQTSIPGATIPNTDYTVVAVNAGRFGATQFQILMKPGKERSAVGTYSYAISPSITDDIRTVTSTGNLMDQNHNAVSGEGSGTSSLSSATIPTSPDGFGYSVNDILTIFGGAFTAPATLRVDAVDTTGNITGFVGSILAVTVLQGGSYTVPPTSPVTVLGGGGFSALFNLAFSISGGDIFAVPSPINGAPFTLPYSQDTLPLIIPGPHMVSTSVAFNPNANLTAPDNLVLNGTNRAVNVTFDRNIVPSTFTAGNIIRMVGPNGPIPTYSMSTPAVIPDAVGGTPGILTSTLTVNDSLAIANVGVGVNITHARDADLSVVLIAPDGTQVPLFAGGTGANLINTVFDDSAATAIAAGTGPYTGTFRPVPGTTLGSLNGKNYLGTWQLVVTDKTAGPVGAATLNSWTLNPITVVPVFTPSSAVLTAGGSGYTLNDILTVQGGVFQAAAQVQVQTVDAQGAVTAVTLVTPGGYLTTPANPGAVTGGSGSGATLTLGYITRTFQVSFPTQHLNGSYYIVVGPDKLGNYVTDFELNNAVPTAAGSGYAVGDVLTVVGGTFTAPAQLQVTSVNPNGAITSVMAIQPGSYSVNPTSPAMVTTTGTGTGALFNLSFGHLVDTNLNAGVNLLRGGDPNNGTVLTNPFASGTLNKLLPAGQTIDSVLNVPASFLVEGVIVQLSIQHQFDPDLTATLIGPDGTSVQLFAGVGSTGALPHANFTNTTFDDSAISPIQLAPTLTGGIGIGAGPFTPQLPLSNFKGLASLGKWTLRIHSNSSTLNGALVNWTLTLKSSVPGSGLGEPIADQFTVPFRIFTQDPSSPVAQNTWTPVGPASIHSGGSSGRIGGLAVDPSDPSGNTVYVAGASGGVWKTNNFLTHDGNGPTYVPLTDLGQGSSLETGSIAVFARNNDPNQSIIFVATGEGSTGSSGVGFLRSMDAGRTWRVLDSTVNIDATGTVLPIASPLRDHIFVGTTSFKVIVDPKPETNGQVIVYAALSGGKGGIWRSLDTGGSWALLQAGNATDVVLAANSAGSSGNLQILYGALRGLGVYFTNAAPTTNTMFLLNGGTGDNIRRDGDNTPDTAIPVGNPGVNPNGANGRIVLAVPALTGNPLQDTLYEGWLYAAVSTTGGGFQGLYVTKDFGLNWTQIRLAVKGTGGKQIPTNDFTQPDYAVDGSMKFPQANYNVTLAVDPNNVNIVYFGGTADGNPFGFIRVDITRLGDPFALVGDDLTIKKPDYGLITGRPPRQYFNLARDPANPFLTPTSLVFTNVVQFNNTGDFAYWKPFTGGGLGGTDQHQIVAMRDPLTGHTMVIFGDDQGVWVGNDKGDGTPSPGIGNATAVLGSRNGNLQITQFYQGAAQPSTLASDLAGALFYGVAQDDGFPSSNPNLLNNGNINWGGGSGAGDATGVVTDQTGTGTAYFYKWPCCGASPLAVDFWSVALPGSGEVSRTQGLLQAGDDPNTSTGNWGFLGGSRFAVNPIDPTAVAMSSKLGRVFFTAGPSIGTGIQWFPIADPSDLDSTYAPAIAFGAPSSPAATILNNFIYAGTSGGHIYMTFTGGGVGTPWTDISAGLDGSGVQEIVTNPTRGSHEAYAVTSSGVYHMVDSRAAGATWVKITGNLFDPALTRVLYDDPAQQQATLKFLSTIQADWRYAIPDDLANPTGATHPVLYVGGMGGVYRSLDEGVSWTYFPNIAIDGAPQEGGFLPSNQITQLSLSVGNLNPANGVPSQTTGRNLLLATTYGRGDFAIRLTDSVKLGNGDTLAKYAANPIAGPHIIAIAPVLTAGTTQNQYANSVIGFSSQFSTTSWAASQATGAPDTFRYGDVSSAWSPLVENGSQEFLTLGYANPVLANGVDVRETWGNGFVTQIDLLDVNNVYHTVFTGPDTTLPGVPGDLVVTFAPTSYLVKGVKVYVDTNHNLQTFEEIDSVQLLSAAPSTGDLGGLTVTFSGPVDPATFTSADLLDPVTGLSRFTDPKGNPLQIARIVDLNATTHNVYQIVLANPTNALGFYRVAVGPAITDYSGNAMDQNQNLANGETPGDIFTGSFFFQPFANHAPTLVTNTTGLVPVQVSGTPNTGTDVASLITALGTNIADTDDAAYAPATAPRGIAVTSVDNTNGAWQYSTDSGTTWTPFGAPSATSARLLQGNSTTRVRFVANANYSGDATFTYVAWDLTTGVPGGLADASVGGGSTAFSADPQSTATLSINHAPTFTLASPPAAANEDAPLQTVPAFAGNMLAGPPNEVLTQTLVGFTVVQTGATGGLTFTTAPAIDVTTGNLTYQPAPNTSGTATFTAKLTDSGSNVAPNTNNSTQSFTITVNFVNDAPTFTLASNPTANENAPAQTVPNFATAISAGPANESSQTLVGLTVTQTGSTGTLTFTTPPVIDVRTGTLTYQPAPNTTGTATFNATLTDSGSGVAPNVNSSTQSFTISVSLINQPPTFTLAGNPVVNENAGPQTIPAFASALSVGPPSEQATQTLVGFTIAQTAATGGLTFTTQPAIDVNTGNLSFQAASNSTGTATFTATLTDSGSNVAPNVNNSTQTFTITVSLVNQPPTFNLAGNPPAVNENAGTQTVANFATSMSVGPPSEQGTQTLVGFTVAQTGVTGGLTFTTQPSIDVTTGTLSYKAAPNTSGTATFTATLTDSGSNVAPNVNSSTKSFTITVNFINQPPTFTLAGNQSVNQNAPAQTVPNFATAISAGPPNESSQTLVGFTVTQTGATGNLTFTTAPAVNVATGTLTYQPAANTSGTATFNVTLTDSGSNVAPNVNNSTQSFTIAVHSLNVPPTFTASTPPPVNEDSGTVTLPNWATYTPGAGNNPADEALLRYNVTTISNPALFSAPPAIDNNGTLTYTPAANASGTSTFIVTAQDAGGTANGNDTSAPQTFTIAVNFVNDAPTFTLASNPAVNENAPLQTVANFAAALSAGPANESSQTLADFTITQTASTNNLAFTTPPSINLATGALTFQPAANSSGTATFSASLTDNGSNVAPNVNTSTQSFTITVHSHNIPPTFTASSPPAVNEDSATVTIPGWAAYVPGAGSNPADEALLRYKVTAVGNPSLFATAPAIDNTGTLTYTPAANASGTSTFTVTAQDAGGTINGSDTSAPQTFTITVSFVNDAPTFTLANNPPSVNQNAPFQTVPNFATAISAGPANESSQSLLGFTVTQTSSTGNLTFTTPPAINLASGALTYQAAPNTGGTATFNATLTDNGSNVAPNVNNTTHSFTITVARTSVTIGNQTLSHTQSNLTINLLPTGSYQVQEAGTQAWFVAHNQGLFFTGNYSQNYGGANEKWLKGNVNQFNSPWYFVKPNGELWAWDGTPSLASGARVATLEPVYWLNPTMLWSATSGSYAYALQQGLGLTFTGDFHFNNKGLQERSLQGAGGASYYITPDGKFYTSSGLFLATLDPIYWSQPSRLYNAQPNQVNAPLNQVNITVQPGAPPTLVIQPINDYVGGWVGQLTTTVGTSTTSQTFNVTVTDALPTIAPIADQSMTASVNGPIPTLNVPLTIHDADNDPINVTGQTYTQGYILQTTYNLTGEVPSYTNYLHLGEKWIRGKTNDYQNPWYIILPNGKLYQWNATATQTATTIAPLADLGAQTGPVYYAFPDLLYGTTPNRYVESTGSFNYSKSLNEKWFTGNTNQNGNPWYFLVPNGATAQLYAWDGHSTSGSALVANGALLANVSSYYYTNSNLLYQTAASDLGAALRLHDVARYASPGVRWLYDAPSATWYIMKPGQLLLWDHSSQPTGSVFTTLDTNYYTAVNTATPMFTVAATSTNAAIAVVPAYSTLLGDFWVGIDASDINPANGRKTLAFFKVTVHS